MGIYLAFKEVWRNRGRFVLFSLVIALITVLVLFVAALAEGLGAGNREFIQKLNADLLVYDSRSDLLIPSSRLGQDVANRMRRMDGVRNAALIGFSNVTIATEAGKELKVALIGVEPGRPGEPPVVDGQPLSARRAKEAILDRQTALRIGLKPGDTMIVRSTQVTEEQQYQLRVQGVSDGRQYSLQPSVIAPILTWDRIKPQAAPYDPDTSTLIGNVVALQLNDRAEVAQFTDRLEREETDLRALTLKEAYENAPGYSAQQSTLNTQRYFALLIGILVIGGFFQIQTLQKVPQIGVLKAIGASNRTVGTAAITQIILVTVLGVGIGSAGTLALSLGFPPTIPITFAPNAVLAAVASLLLIGPIGGLVSVRYSLRIEPLTALGLSN